MTILLFDVDGTLTPSSKIIEEPMIEAIDKLSENPNIILGIVGGGTWNKINSQLGTIIDKFKYVFVESGAITYIDGNCVFEKDMLEHCDRKVLNDIIKTALLEISKMPIVYSGHQIDFRKGLIYISPIGMQATSCERDDYIKLDNQLSLRNNLILKLLQVDKNKLFEITQGGSVGISVSPVGWNKSQVLEFFKDTNDTIYYFGDKTEPDGNDYPLYSNPRVIGVNVKNYHDTIKKIKNIN